MTRQTKSTGYYGCPEQQWSNPQAAFVSVGQCVLHSLDWNGDIFCVVLTETSPSGGYQASVTFRTVLGSSFGRCTFCRKQNTEAAL